MKLAKHRQVKYFLRATIESGRLAPHDLLPSERELAREHKVSVETIRATLRELIAEGIIYRVERKGTFVAPPSKKHQILVVAKNPFHIHAWDTTVIPFFLGLQEKAGSKHPTAFP
ncbi:MAG: winged helix-turn-helix transcriptional regulator, partial [Spirochaetia bacterium]|nr:winged helix-turn-helix transcriptional regulator [Spirochaetia bacterium]